jgi:hypothetical protein
VRADPERTYRSAIARHNARVDEYNAIVAEMHQRDDWDDAESAALRARLERTRAGVERARSEAEALRADLDRRRSQRRSSP